MTSPCDASSNAGQELHAEVAEIINKVACGCRAVAGKQEKVDASAPSAAVNGALS